MPSNIENSLEQPVSRPSIAEILQQGEKLKTADVNSARNKTDDLEALKGMLKEFFKGISEKNSNKFKEINSLSNDLIERHSIIIEDVFSMLPFTDVPHLILTLFDV